MPKGPKLGREDWRCVLDRLSAELADGPPSQIIAIGGVAFAFAFDSRRTTQDFDAVLDPADAPRILAAADKIAPEFGLPSGWLNERAKHAGLLPPQVSGDVHLLLKVGCIDILIPGAEQLLAMKLMAFRDETDREDALILLRTMNTAGLDLEDVWNRVGGFVLPAKRHNTRLNLDDLWELISEAI
ncbi:hypothetical protein LZC95_22580 [Pendulispora brunnea]|uniref:DUF6036 domain-containing protein n=1 Tax=Pendulispora brunnea TaxID=2905690 RepID=A0ABZ2KRB9_9BACT